jgi:hypothetical protein
MVTIEELPGMIEKEFGKPVQVKGQYGFYTRNTVEAKLWRGKDNGKCRIYIRLIGPAGKQGYSTDEAGYVDLYEYVRTGDLAKVEYRLGEMEDAYEDLMAQIAGWVAMQLGFKPEEDI